MITTMQKYQKLLKVQADIKLLKKMKTNLLKHLIKKELCD